MTRSCEGRQGPVTQGIAGVGEAVRVYSECCRKLLQGVKEKVVLSD